MKVDRSKVSSTRQSLGVESVGVGDWCEREPPINLTQVNILTLLKMPLKNVNVIDESLRYC